MAVYLKPVDQGRAIVLDKAIILFGRHPDCDVVLSDSRKVSRRHCCIAQVDNRLVVRDLGSTNGVRVNGRRIRTEAALRSGDEICVGDARYQVTPGTPDFLEPDSDGNGSHLRSSGSARREDLVGQPQDADSEIPMIRPEDLVDEDNLLEIFPELDTRDRVVPVEDSGEFQEHGSEIEIVED